MLADTKLNRLNGATRECLEQCYQSDNWLDCLANYVEALRSDGWSEKDIDEVETTVVRILRAIAASEAAQGHDNVADVSRAYPVPSQLEVANCNLN